MSACESTESSLVPDLINFHYRGIIDTSCIVTVQSQPLLYKVTYCCMKTISFIITKCIIISLSAPLTRVCQRASLKLTAGHFISRLADKESFWVHCLRGKNYVWLLLADNREQNSIGTRECG